MISALHLLWIIPLSILAGTFCTALAAINNTTREDNYGENQKKAAASELPVGH